MIGITTARRAFSSRKIALWVIATGTFLAIGVSAWLAIEYRNTPILGIYGFRQTQTALTSYWACHGPIRASYWTPVGGYPWSIPFEFPIYQWIVSLIACPLGINLDPVGRVVSYVFWLGCLWPALIVCKRLFDQHFRLYFWTFSALFMSAPVYLHWGRSFMIESAALFFALSYLAFSLEMSFGRDRRNDAILTGVFLTLAILQKSTTVLPLLLFAAVYLWRCRGDIFRDRIRSARLQKAIIAYLIPFVIGVAWVEYTDLIKTANPLGTYLTSSALRNWNFGPMAARYTSELWKGIIWNRVIVGNVAGYLGVFSILIGFAFVRERRVLIAAGVGLFLLYFMVFENLLFVHEYYPFSNTVYLIFALTVAIGGLIEARPNLAIFAAIAFAGVVAINLHGYLTSQRFTEDSMSYEGNQVLDVGTFIRAHTSPDEPLLVYGDDWNSQLPYYTQRKAFVVPTFFKPYLQPLVDPKKYLNGQPGAVLLCDSERNNQVVLKMITDTYPTWSKTAMVKCDVFLPKL